MEVAASKLFVANACVTLENIETGSVTGVLVLYLGHDFQVSQLVGIVIIRVIISVSLSQ